MMNETRTILNCTDVVSMLEKLEENPVPELTLAQMGEHVATCERCRMAWARKRKEVKEWAVEGVDRVLGDLYRIGFPPPAYDEPAILRSVLQQAIDGQLEEEPVKRGLLRMARHFIDQRLAEINIQKAWFASAVLARDPSPAVVDEARGLLRSLQPTVVDRTVVVGPSPADPPRYALAGTLARQETQQVGCELRADCGMGDAVGKPATEEFDASLFGDGEETHCALSAAVRTPIDSPYFTATGFTASFKVAVPAGHRGQDLIPVLFVKAPRKDATGLWFPGTIDEVKVEQENGKEYAWVSFAGGPGIESLADGERLALNPNQYNLVLFAAEGPKNE